MDAVIAIVFLLFWIALAIAMYYGYLWMRKQERDTRLMEEEGRQPQLEVFGAGRINRRQWSNKTGCRVSIYDDFLVVSVSSQRRSIPLYMIRGVEVASDGGRMTIHGLTEDETLLSIDFRGPDVARLAEYLRDHGRGMKVAPNV